MEEQMNFAGQGFNLVFKKEDAVYHVSVQPEMNVEDSHRMTGKYFVFIYHSDKGGSSFILHKKENDTN